MGNLYTAEFEEWYSAYPRRQAKSDSFRNFEKVRKARGLDFIQQCTKNYLDYYNTLPEDKKQYAYASNNFLGRKEYYLDYEQPIVPQAQQPQQKTVELDPDLLAYYRQRRKQA
jgi:hypothetical protein